MMNKEFKYDLGTVYSEVERLAKEYRQAGLSDIQKNFILGELLDVSKELVINMCKKFLRERNTDELTVEELYEIAITEPLLDVLDWHDFSQKGEIMVNWISFMEKRFCNALKEKRTKKAMWAKSHLYSSNVNFNEDGTTIEDLVGDDDFSESFCTNMTLGKLIKDFEEKDKYGKLIKYLLIGNQSARTTAFLEVLGAEEYGDSQRKAVQRTKERFVKFLIHNNYDLAGYDLKKYL